MNPEDQKAFDEYIKNNPMDCTWETVFMAGKEWGEKCAREKK